MLPNSETEYGGIVQILEKLESRFIVRAARMRLRLWRSDSPRWNGVE